MTRRQFIKLGNEVKKKGRDWLAGRCSWSEYVKICDEWEIEKKKREKER